MNFIKPKNKNVEKVDWLLSERTRAIVKYYAEYTEYSESEVVDKILLNILEDKDFIDWIEKKRNNRRIVKQLELEHSLEEDVIG
jgi:DNA relaxase NicK